MSPNTANLPEVIIEGGPVFIWRLAKPTFALKSDPTGLWIEVRDLHITSEYRPRHWWDFASWVRVCRALWRMPA